jgi:hypothetical protein
MANVKSGKRDARRETRLSEKREARSKDKNEGLKEISDWGVGIWDFGLEKTE